MIKEWERHATDYCKIETKNLVNIVFAVMLKMLRKAIGVISLFFVVVRVYVTMCVCEFIVEKFIYRRLMPSTFGVLSLD